jgi:hypothetical protein
VTIGFDLGSYQFRTMRSVENKLVARRCPAVFAAISDTPAHRRLLQQSSTRFAMCSDQLLVFGDDAREWSEMLNLSLSPLLRGGRVPTSDSVSRQVLTLMVDALLPSPTESNTLCQMTLPGGCYDERTENRDAEFFQQLVALRGYRPKFMTATLALALSELNEATFTGIAITLGHTTCEFGIVHCGREIVRCVVMSGLESFQSSSRLGEQNNSPEPLAASANVERDYVRFFAEVISEARVQFELDGTLKTLPRSMPVVCSGGITTEASFLPLFQRAWDDSKWPVTTRPIRVAADNEMAVVRGCLIQAELEQPSERKVA